MTALKLVAFDDEDLKIISAHLQDGVLRVGDMAYLPKERRFAALLNRFDWLRAAGADPDAEPGRMRRLRSAIRFEHVRSCKVQGIAQDKKREILCLLAIAFEPGNPGEPEGFIDLTFAGGGTVRLEVECIEFELRDLGPGWRTQAVPEHRELKS